MIYGYVPTNYYFNSLHSIVSEAEHGIIAGRNIPLPLLTATPQFSGDGYTNIATNNEVLFLSILYNLVHVICTPIAASY